MWGSMCPDVDHGTTAALDKIITLEMTQRRQRSRGSGRLPWNIWHKFIRKEKYAYSKKSIALALPKMWNF